MPGQVMEFVKMIEVIKCLKEAGSVIIFVDFFYESRS